MSDGILEMASTVVGVDKEQGHLHSHHGAGIIVWMQPWGSDLLSAYSLQRAK